MTRILAFDLAWSGPTGWCEWEDEIVNYGFFVPPTKAKSTLAIASWIVREVNHLLLTLTPIDIVVYEITDWHRRLKGLSGKKFDIEYKIERQAQRTLGKAESAITLAVAPFLGNGVGTLIDIGANEAKREFGATRKDACASLLASQYPERFESHDLINSYLYDKELERDVLHHESDAMVIASVVAARERLAQLAI